MRSVVAILMCVAASQAQAEAGERGRVGETWVYPVTFQQALSPLAPLAREAVTGGKCPALVVGQGEIVHSYDFDVQMRTRGTGDNRRWLVEEIKLLNPSACPDLDSKVTAVMRDAIPQFAEPWKDLDGNGWTRIPRIQLRLTD